MIHKEGEAPNYTIAWVNAVKQNIVDSGADNVYLGGPDKLDIGVNSARVVVDKKTKAVRICKPGSYSNLIFNTPPLLGRYANTYATGTVMDFMTPEDFKREHDMLVSFKAKDTVNDFNTAKHMFTVSSLPYFEPAPTTTRILEVCNSNKSVSKIVEDKHAAMFRRDVLKLARVALVQAGRLGGITGKTEWADVYRQAMEACQGYEHDVQKVGQAMWSISKVSLFRPTREREKELARDTNHEETTTNWTLESHFLDFMNPGDVKVHGDLAPGELKALQEIALADSVRKKAAGNTQCVPNLKAVNAIYPDKFNALLFTYAELRAALIPVPLSVKGDKRYCLADIPFVCATRDGSVVVPMHERSAPPKDSVSSYTCSLSLYAVPNGPPRFRLDVHQVFLFGQAGYAGPAEVVVVSKKPIPGITMSKEDVKPVNHALKLLAAPPSDTSSSSSSSSNGRYIEHDSQNRGGGATYSVAPRF